MDKGFIKHASHPDSYPVASYVYLGWDLGWVEAREMSWVAFFLFWCSTVKTRWFSKNTVVQ